MNIFRRFIKGLIEPFLSELRAGSQRELTDILAALKTDLRADFEQKVAKIKATSETAIEVVRAENEALKKVVVDLTSDVAAGIRKDVSQELKQVGLGIAEIQHAYTMLDHRVIMLALNKKIDGLVNPEPVVTPEKKKPGEVDLVEKNFGNVVRLDK
jgi:hypothetical protein